MTSLTLITALFMIFAPTLSLFCNKTSCQSLILKDTDIQCTIDESCRFSPKIYATDTDVRCSSKYSCSDANAITANRYVLCEGTESCGYTNGTIESLTDYVACNGHKSCCSTYTSNIKAITSIYCWGYQSCIGVNSLTVTNGHLFCGSTQSCYDISDGMYSSSISCQGTLSCANSPIKYGDKLWCIGERSCRGTSITNVLSIRAYGYRSMMYGVINATSELTIYLYGYESGKDLQIHCYSICNIECNGNGCKETTIYTYNNSNIFINCNETLHIDCPIDGSINTLMPTTLPTFSPTINTIEPDDKILSTTLSPTLTPPCDLIADKKIIKKNENNLALSTWIIIFVILIIFFIILQYVVYMYMETKINILKQKNNDKKKQVDLLHTNSKGILIEGANTTPNTGSISNVSPPNDVNDDDILPNTDDIQHNIEMENEISE